MPVVFKFARHCAFGESFAVTGSTEQLGNWDTSRAVRMAWTPSDRWVARVSLPADAHVEYKFIKVASDTGDVVGRQPEVLEWEECPEREDGLPPPANLSLDVKQGHERWVAFVVRACVRLRRPIGIVDHSCGRRWSMFNQPLAASRALPG